MEYIKIPIICADAILALGEAECGRLLMSLLEYSRGGGTVEPRGAEKSIYLILKAQMDKDTETGRKRAENGRKGGIAKSSKLKQNLASDSIPPSPLPSPPMPPVSISPSPKEKPPKGGRSPRLLPGTGERHRPGGLCGLLRSAGVEIRSRAAHCRLESRRANLGSPPKGGAASHYGDIPPQGLSPGAGRGWTGGCSL